MLLTTPATTIFLCAYTAAKNELEPHLGNSVHNWVISGTIAEVASSFLWTPMEVLKSRLQISTSDVDGKLLYQVRDIAKKEGLKGFYRGYIMGVTNYVPYNAIYWTAYESIKQSSRMSDRSDFEKSLVGGAIGSVLFSTRFAALLYR
jgi:solute carrier family 25 iron transporter 28/37